MIRAIAIDDEPPALQVLTNFCSKVDFVSLDKTFTKTEEAFSYIKNNPVDLLFLDINMPSISGIDFYKQLAQKTMVIFTTAYTEYAVEGFNLDALDYLLKPFTPARFMQAMDKARDYQQYLQANQKQEHVFVRADYSLIKLALADILYIEGLDDYLKIHLHNQKPLVIRITMKAMMEKLPAASFIRVHRSYIVPFAKIERVRNKIISIGSLDIPISSSYEAAFFERYKG